MNEDRDELVVLKGTKLTIQYAVDATGGMPAKEFLNAKPGKKGPTNQEKAGLFQVFQTLVEHGQVHNPQQFKKQRDEIWSFKKYQARIAAFRVGNVWYLTHGFKKKTDQWPGKEFDKANRIRAEHLARKDKRK